MKVERQDGYVLPPPYDVLRLQEAWTYRISHSGATAARLGSQHLPRNPDHKSFELTIAHIVGSFLPLVLETETGDRLEYPVEILPREEKLSPEAWSELLVDLDAWLSGVTVGAEAARHGHVSARGMSASLLVEALLPTLPALIGALRTILEAPRERARTEIEDVPIHAVRRADGATLRWLGRHPIAVAALSGKNEDRPPLVPQRLGLDSVDHPANRYLAWLIRRIVSTLSECASELRRLSSAQSSKAEVSNDGNWLSARAKELDGHAESLESLRRRSFLRSLTPQTATEAALTVFQDDPRYARFHRFARPFLSPRFRLQSSEAAPKAATRPSFTLYELWTFLQIQRLLERELCDAEWSHAELERLFAFGATGEGARYRADLRDQGRIELLFNPTFKGYFNSSKGDRFSLTGERRPDLVITWSPRSGEPAWICLDAKYRAGRSNLADAMESLHIYRDSLRYETFRGQCRAAFILTPAQGSDCGEWFSEEFATAHGFGAIRLTPGAQEKEQFAGRLLRLLGQLKA